MLVAKSKLDKTTTRSINFTSHLHRFVVANNTAEKPGPAELDEDDDVPDLVENFDEASKDD